MCVKERERVCVCERQRICVCEKEIQCVRERKREGERESACVCERERKGTGGGGDPVPRDRLGRLFSRQHAGCPVHIRQLWSAKSPVSPNG